MAKNDPPEAEQTALGDLAKLGAALAQAADDTAAQTRILDQIVDQIGALDKETGKSLMQRPEVRALFEAALEVEVTHPEKDPPGTIYYKTIQGERIPWSKKAWSWPDIIKRCDSGELGFGWVDVRPERKETIFFQGVPLTVAARRSQRIPSVFADQMIEKMRAEELAEQHAAWLFKKRDRMPDDPSIVTVEGANVRARANHDGRINTFLPGGGVPALGDPAGRPA